MGANEDSGDIGLHERRRQTGEARGSRTPSGRPANPRGVEEGDPGLRESERASGDDGVPGSPENEPEGSEPQAEFPYVGMCVGVVALNAILAAVSLPPNPLCAAVAVASFFAIGYCVLSLIAGKRIALSAAETLAFTVGLTVLITSLSALASSLIGVPITEQASVLVGLPLASLALLAQRSGGHPWKALEGFFRGWIDFSDYSRIEKALAAALLVAVAGALVVFVSLAGIQYPDRPSMGIAIAGGDGTPQTLPTSFAGARPETIVVYVLANHTPAWPASGPGSFEVRIRLIPSNATGNVSFHSISGGSPLRLDAFGQFNDSMEVGPGGTWSQAFSIALSGTGRFTLVFDLVRPPNSALTSVHLPVAAT